MKILFTTQLPTEGFARLSGYELDMPATPYYTPAEIGIRIAGADVLVATFDYRITREIIEAWCAAKHPRNDSDLSRPLNCNEVSSKLIANLGVGYNNIDLDACREHNILVTNTPLPVIEPTAELCFALMHDIARRTALFDRQLRQGTAEPFGVMNNLSHSLYGKTLGIIGMGRIGKAVARRAIAAGMRVIYYQRHPLEETSVVSLTSDSSCTSLTYVPMEELLRTADFVSLHLPYTAETHHIIGERELGMMKPTAYLINTARGAHVDEAILVRFLQEKKIAGAALDVYEHEPTITEALKTLDNVVLSPHTGTATMEARLAMCENVTDNILAFLAGQYDSMNIVK